MATTAFALFSPWVAAQTLPANAGDVIDEENRQIWRYGADSTSSQEQVLVRRILSATGAQQQTSVALGYQEGWQTLEVIDAYTLKSDGRKLVVQADSIQKQTGLLGGSTGVTYPEYRALQLKFPDVQMGDKVVLHVKLSQIKPYLPGWGGHQWFANHNWTTEKIDIEVHAPKDLPLYIEADGLTATSRDEAGHQIRRYSGQVDAAGYDADARNATTTVSRLMVSTLASHEVFGNLFAQAMQSRMAANDNVKEIALRETKGLGDATAKTRALYDWVRKNIRYNAVFIGAGGFSPNTLDHILKTRYGDCKDQALLLLSLLQAAGVPGVPALLNVGTDFALNRVETGFNHVIVHVPELGLYLDPTATHAPYGELPVADRGKPVVLARAQGSSRASTPPLAAENNQLVTQGNFKISATGGLKGVLRIVAKGRAAMVLQEQLALTPPGMGAQAVQRYLQQSRLSGTGNVRFAALNRDVAEQTVEIDLDVSNFLRSPEAGSLTVNPVLTGLPVYVLGNYSNYTAEQRRFAILCTPVTVREEFAVEFDPKLTLQRVPQDAKISGPDDRFESKYRLENGVLTGSREFVENNPSMVCDAEAYAKRKVVMRSITRHLRQQMLYQQ